MLLVFTLETVGAPRKEIINVLRFCITCKTQRLPLRKVLTREKPAFRGRRSNNGALAVKRSGTATAEFIATRLRGQAVKTSPFHGGNTGPNPVGVIKALSF